MLVLSENEEMYLKRKMAESMQNQIKSSGHLNLAEIMKVSSASTTEMLIRLSKRELLTYLPYTEGAA